jgi:tetratricopeptide (TPR) repeat protein
VKICSVTMHGPDTPTDPAVLTVKDLVYEPLLLYHRKPITDFSQARNDALEIAHENEFDWAIMLDTDERIQCDDPQLIRDHLAGTTADVIMVPHVSGSYEKERIFRLPARGFYVGPTHEAWITSEGAKRTTWHGITFDEVPKSAEEYRAKIKRDEAILEEYVVRHPKDPRWWYYLADTYSGLGKTDDAIETFATCYRLNGWDEESAWAAYRAASLLAEQCSYKDAIAWCLRGMERRADFPEFPWLAGWCAYKQWNYRQAVRWEQLAINMRWNPGDRIGFRFPPAHAEAPWDVLRYAYRALGSDYEAGYAEEQFVLEEKRREQSQPH